MNCFGTLFSTSSFCLGLNYCFKMHLNKSNGKWTPRSLKCPTVTTSPRHPLLLCSVEALSIGVVICTQRSNWYPAFIHTWMSTWVCTCRSIFFSLSCVHRLFFYLQKQHPKNFLYPWLICGCSADYQAKWNTFVRLDLLYIYFQVSTCAFTAEHRRIEIHLKDGEKVKHFLGKVGWKLMNFSVFIFSILCNSHDCAHQIKGKVCSKLGQPWKP